jgi:hypothetical protein
MHKTSKARRVQSSTEASVKTAKQENGKNSSAPCCQYKSTLERTALQSADLRSLQVFY